MEEEKGPVPLFSLYDDGGEESLTREGRKGELSRALKRGGRFSSKKGKGEKLLSASDARGGSDTSFWRKNGGGGREEGGNGSIRLSPCGRGRHLEREKEMLVCLGE